MQQVHEAELAVLYAEWAKTHAAEKLAALAAAEEEHAVMLEGKSEQIAAAVEILRESEEVMAAAHHRELARMVAGEAAAVEGHGRALATVRKCFVEQPLLK